MTTDYDIAIIGGGPGGYAAAIRAGRLGKKTLLIEKDALGGTCLNRGCLPTKYLIGAVTTLKKTLENPFIENKTALKLDFPALVSSKDILVKKLAKSIESLVRSAGVEIVKGVGKITGDGFVEIDAGGDTHAVKAADIIIATGSQPIELPHVKIDEDRVLSSTGFLNMKELPETFGIIGGGAIGCECAYILAVAGVKVTVIEMLGQILPAEDRIVAKTLENALKKIGIEILTGVKIEKVETQKEGLRCSLSSGEQKVFQKILVSVGRKGVLEETGGRFAKDRFIQVNKQFETALPHVYAIGDVNGRSMYAHAATAQGIAVAEHIAGNNPAIDQDLIPRCVYTQPEVASVGLTEDEATGKGIEVKTARFPYAALGKAHALNAADGFFKIVADSRTYQILGIQIIGEEATDLIGEAVALISKGATADDLSRMVHPHPTLSEGYWEIANLILGRPMNIQKPRS
jgi:dihydrolipoamide dehydrogenase